MKNSDDDSVLINYEKYLKCPDCKKDGLYCPKHRIEVETILRKRY